MFATLHLCDDVSVVPVTSVRQHIAHGGPIWPQFDRQSGLRHCRNNAPVDQAPLPAQGPEKPVKAAVWGGFLDRHFGHFVAEHLPRLPFALRARPDDLYLFTVEPGTRRHDLPDWVWAVLAWVGLPASQVQLVTEPLRVRRLHGGLQAEMLPQIAPEAGYLDLLDDLAQTPNLPVMSSDLVYVARADLPRSGGGGTAGEGYLTECLARLGVAVLNPGQAPLATQLAAYRGARHLIFSEGSALHGRQLLGRLPQRLSVLRRRRGRSMARGMLTPRVEALSYREVTFASLVPQWKNGLPRPDPALALYDVPALFAAFAGLDVPLSQVWDTDAYLAAAQSDLAAWITHRPPNPALQASYQQSLAGTGLRLPAPHTAPSSSHKPV